MNINKTPLSVLVTIGAALAMPVAFAQSARQDAPTSPPAAAADQTQAEPTQAANAAAGAQPRQVTWADLDGDKDGNLSKQEVTAVPELSQVFDQADADGNGKLTAEEYKTFAANAAAGGSANGS